MKHEAPHAQPNVKCLVKIWARNLDVVSFLMAWSILSLLSTSSAHVLYSVYNTHPSVMSSSHSFQNAVYSSETVQGLP